MKKKYIFPVICVMFLFFAISCRTSTIFPAPTATLTLTSTSTFTPTRTPSSTPLPTLTLTGTPNPLTTDPDVWDKYEDRSLDEFIALFKDEVLSDITVNSFWLNYGNPYRSIVPFIYTGEFRETQETLLMALTIWGQGAYPDKDAEYVETLYAMEGLFLENGKEYWLPVQSQLIHYMEDELKPETKFRYMWVLLALRI